MMPGGTRKDCCLSTETKNCSLFVFNIRSTRLHSALHCIPKCWHRSRVLESPANSYFYIFLLKKKKKTWQSPHNELWCISCRVGGKQCHVLTSLSCKTWGSGLAEEQGADNRNRALIVFVHLFMCIKYLIFIRWCVCCTNTSRVTFAFDWTCLCGPDYSDRNKTKDLVVGWAHALYLHQLHVQSFLSSLVSGRFLFFFHFVLFCPPITHVAASEITVPLSKWGPPANREDLLPGDTCWSVGSSVQGGRCFRM